MGRQFAPRVLVLGSFALVALAFAWPLPAHMGTHLTGDPGGDTGVYVWNQWVFHQELTNAHNPLSTGKILALTPRVDLSQHNYTAFLDLLAFPLISWLGVIASFNVVFLTIGWLNALTAYGLARRAMGAGRWEAWLAGVAFAWSPVLIARGTGHFSLVAAAPLPAFVWCLINAERSRSWRDAALVGVCMAWAAFCDAYFGVYCLMIAAIYILATIIRVRRAESPARLPWTWLLDVVLVSIAGLVFGMLVGIRGVFSVLGFQVSVRELYTPMFVLTVLAGLRMLIAFRPRIDAVPRLQPWAVKLALVGVLACAGPLSPVLFGVGRSVIDGRFVSPDIFWRSSPSGVDVLSFFSPNPSHPLVRALAGDWQQSAPTQFVEYVASVSLLALVIVGFAVWRGGFRPKAGWWWVTGGFAALALGPFLHVAGYNTHIPGPWALLRYVPVIGLARTPSRFAIVTALGLAILMAGALASLGARWPQRRRLVLSVVTLLLFVELWPAPRTLYSAEISPVYDTIAADSRPIRVLTLPFGVRDGVSSAGNFRARSQFNQTRHGKTLIGGYLSRISQKRIDRMRQDFPTLSVLMKMSEPQPLEAADLDILRSGGAAFVRLADLAYVVLDERFITQATAAPVIASFGLREIQRDRHLVLYTTGF
ncbi:MAG: hypothetical protein ABI665_22105 [Vicinamibacterales bacterium]